MDDGKANAMAPAMSAALNAGLDRAASEAKAVVIPAAGCESGAELERELIEYCRNGIAHYKCPRTIDFVSELPRTETGKMAKRKLRDRFLLGIGSFMV